jgi:4-hydroxy-tetrahydrodipicolinate synthase
MITPFTNDDRLDFDALAAMIEWYAAHRVDGLFAVCQSSEMFLLSLEERVQLARRCVELAGDGLPVIASGHVSDDFADQVAELRAMAETGARAVVLITNRLAGREENDDVWRRRCEELLAELPDSVPLGLYECPYPYKRVVTPQLLRWCADSGRFVFLKDTCCDPQMIRAKQEVIAGRPFGIYNANAATLLETLRFGIAGYSGVMANYHPELYVWLCRNWSSQSQAAERLQEFLGLASAIEGPQYPRNAKYYQSLEGIPIGQHTRRPASTLGPADRRLVEQLRAVSLRTRNEYLTV